jgi:hypothetical protein
VGAEGAARAMDEDTSDRVVYREEEVLGLAIGVVTIPERMEMSVACLMYFGTLVSMKSANLGVLIIVCLNS